MDIIILAVISVLLLTKLYTLLGKKDDEMTRISKANLLSNHQEIIKLIEQEVNKIAQNIQEEYVPTHENKEINEVFSKMRELDNQITIENFLEGAKRAYEAILNAYSKGNKFVLLDLLDKNLYQSLAEDIENRESQNKILEKILVSIISADITAADWIKNNAKITIKFVSEQINLVKDDKGNIIEGRPSHFERMEDFWTFERNFTSSNQNWKLIAT